MKTTGLDSAAAIPAGATITRTRWAVPGHYGTRTEFDWEDEALAHAISEREAAQAKHVEFYPDEASRIPLPESITIDLRWNIDYPSGGGLDTVASRTVYETLDEARATLSRIAITNEALRAQARARVARSTRMLTIYPGHGAVDEDMFAALHRKAAIAARGLPTPTVPGHPTSMLSAAALDRAGRALTELDHTDDWTHGDYDDPFVRMCARDAAQEVLTAALEEDAGHDSTGSQAVSAATPLEATRLTLEALASQPGLAAPSPLEAHVKLFLQATPEGQADEGRVIHAIARMHDVDAGDVTEAIADSVTRGTIHRRGTLLVLS
ncbi:hypothetical protein [Microbacterium sp. 77mftsu3.1]|uniref:hypothetical protein n=1 Tax=Microbacterium sp. 77mftsu3.1 TaxID=1761802 RepID=UPI000361A7E7|nr:hypothetical protein [Microbacterium sp. 77mftsu3.1]SDH40423.1 hypothetical protein SAMN04488590_3254 [Microbacterium sp. 77mftsu3.1]